MLTSANYYRYMEKSEVIFCDTISCSITLPKAVNITYVKTNFRSGVRGGGFGGTWGVMGGGGGGGGGGWGGVMGGTRLNPEKKVSVFILELNFSIADILYSGGLVIADRLSRNRPIPGQTLIANPLYTRQFYSGYSL